MPVETVRPLDAGGEARATAPTQARGQDLLDDSLRADLEGAAQPDESSVRLEVGDAQRVDDTDPGEGDPLLVAQPWDLVHHTERERVVAAVEETGVEQVRDEVGGDGSVAHAAACGDDLHERLDPQQTAGAVAHQRDVEAARGGLTSQGDGDVVGTDRARGAVAGDVDRGHAGTSAFASSIARCSRATSTRPTRRSLTSAAGPSAQLPRQKTSITSTSPSGVR